MAIAPSLFFFVKVSYSILVNFIFHTCEFDFLYEHVNNFEKLYNIILINLIGIIVTLLINLARIDIFEF